MNAIFLPVSTIYMEVTIMARFQIAVVSGDGIGPEVTEEAKKVMEKIGQRYGHKFSFSMAPAGGCAIDRFNNCLPKASLETCREADAVLLGAVGGPKWDNVPGDKRPEKALLGLREGLGLFANLRPAIIHPSLVSACPLKEEIIGDGLDILIVRELTGGIYFGEHGTTIGQHGKEAYDIERYSEMEVKRIAINAFERAMQRNKKLCSVDKANVLESSRLWRRVVTEVANDYPEVELTHMYVDNAAMQLVRNPKQFDVIVTSNIFGDILSDEASMITGSIGLLPSASLGEGTFGMYEPIHGPAPDIAGNGIANPIATILSLKMMFEWKGWFKEARLIRSAIEHTIEKGIKTEDLGGSSSTKEVEEEICKYIKENLE